MQVIAIIIAPNEYKHSLEVKKILESLKRNDNPPFDKVTKAPWSSFYTSMLRRNIQG
jgi:hypothetical protein